ncbi:hypothetical protein CH293_03120 [Rhodococcus sp. 14-2470-1b]|uniref:hypothetical protein n=1 Tax=Rhodococcus sp. 14-2470-1b TaxID=2023149 RepID=UPI000BD61DC4|nr:hypothetical protein [Rhodococcus sp. 14-2470-1b]OZF56932.1 hypothetical protein CH293_03120 [Rhodococcus sp. 14-2470-1b]
MSAVTEGRYLLTVWTGGVLQVSIDPKQHDRDSPWAGRDPGTFDSVWSTVSPNKSAGDRLNGMEISQSLFAALETFAGVHLSEDDFTDADFSVVTVPRMHPASESDYVRRLREVRWNARELA